jgi:hypothetical protein
MVNPRRQYVIVRIDSRFPARSNGVPATPLLPFFGSITPHAGSRSFREALGVAEGEGLVAGKALGVAEGEGLAPGTALFL